MWKRLARVEAKLAMGPAGKVNEGGERVWFFETIVAFHAGKLSGGESLATAHARALGLSNDESFSAYSPDRDGPSISQLTLAKLNSLIGVRGGRPVAENGKLVFETPEDDGRRDGFVVLDELYEEIPQEIKDRFDLPPHLRDYFVNAINEAKNKRARR
jgi:hypothetical protein